MDKTRVTLGQGFSAAHRLHSQDLSNEENKALFGKCNNPSGHGHNYLLEVTLEGDLDPRTGSSVDLPKAKQTIREITDHFDHKHLNEDCPEFKGLNPTAENVCKVLFSLLKKSVLPGRLLKVGLRETEQSYFEYEEE